MTETRLEKVKKEDGHFCDMLAEKPRRMAEGPQKECLKLEIQQLIVKVGYGNAVLGNHVPNLIPHVDKTNRFLSPTYTNHSISTLTSPSLQSNQRERDRENFTLQHHTVVPIFQTDLKKCMFRAVEEKRAKFVLFVSFLIIKSSCSQMFYKMDGLNFFAKFSGKLLCPSLFFNKVASQACNFIKKAPTQVFLCEILQNF